MQAQAQLHQQNLGGVPMFAHQVQAPVQPFLQPLGQLQPGFSATPGQMATDKVFISGLAPDCDENALESYFLHFGPLIDAHLKYCPSTGLSRGCGFVQFDHFQSVDAVMEHGQPMEIDGRTLEISCNKHLVHNRFVEVKRCLSQDVAQAQAIPLGPPGFQAQAHFPHAGIQQPAGGVDKVFVGGIGDCNEQEFIRYFEQFGAIVDYVVMKDKETGKPRGFGFVRYESQESVEQVLSPEMYRQHLLRGKWIEVKRASPEVKGAGKGSPGHRFAPY
jgi:RNA-binding protein Musashi